MRVFIHLYRYVLLIINFLIETKFPTQLKCFKWTFLLVTEIIGLYLNLIILKSKIQTKN